MELLQLGLPAVWSKELVPRRADQRATAGQLAGSPGPGLFLQEAFILFAYRIANYNCVTGRLLTAAELGRRRECQVLVGLEQICLSLLGP